MVASHVKEEATYKHCNACNAFQFNDVEITPARSSYEQHSQVAQSLESMIVLGSATCTKTQNLQVGQNALYIVILVISSWSQDVSMQDCSSVSRPRLDRFSGMCIVFCLGTSVSKLSA